MKTNKGFAPITIVLIVIAVLAVGSVAYLYFFDGLRITNFDGDINKNLSIPQIPENTDNSVIKITDENYEEQIKWATEENGLPKGWVKWTDTMAEIPVEKFGPSQNDSSYMIKLRTQMVSGIGQEKKCIGDSEVALCAIGNNPEVLRYFNVLEYRY